MSGTILMAPAELYGLRIDLNQGRVRGDCFSKENSSEPYFTRDFSKPLLCQLE